MILGLLPAAGGGIRDLQRTGQHTRLIENYLRTYAAAFEHTHFFSYFDERLADYTGDKALLDKITVWPRKSSLPYRLYALVSPMTYPREFAACDVLRVFQATGALPAIVARARFGTPYAVTYGYRYAEFARTEGRRIGALWLELVERLALRYASAIIVTTAQLQAHLQRAAPPERIHLIPNGVDTAQFAPGPPGIRPDPATVIFVGRLEAQKNLARLIEAMRRVQEQHPARLVLVGEGTLRPMLQAQARDLGVAVEFAGIVEHSALPALLCVADVFVLPSLIEGHPKTLLEAMACGLPCVASDCEGNREVIEDGQTGLLALPDDAGVLAAQITRVLEDEGLARALGVRARETVVRQYDLNSLLAREVALLQSIARR
jgi:glycosyltransferase involved in cell wall biosynthesis